MNSIKVANFKAYSEKIEINLEYSNLLVCGENGSGKTSLYEAIHLAYCQKDIIESHFTHSMTTEERAQIKSDILDAYRCQRNKGREFQLMIDGISFEQYDVADKVALFIAEGLTSSYDTINLAQIMRRLNLSQSIIDGIKESSLGDIIENVNHTLRDTFFENIVVGVSEDGNFNCQVSDSDKGLDKKEDDLTMFFNESKLHLIVSLFAMVVARFYFDQTKEMQHLLVVDDIVSSMDMMNRELLVKYILDHFCDAQLIVFTHNISFFNLFAYNIKYFRLHDKWIYRHLYEVGGIHRVYNYEENTVKSLRDRLNKGEDPESMGNDIRKRFETLIVELARLRNIDSQVEPLTNVIEKLTNGKCIYMKRDGDKVSDANDMLTEVIALIKKVPTIDGLKDKVGELIKAYTISNEEFQPLIDVLKDLTIYQKLVMHQLSHGTHQKATFSMKEQQLSFKLLEQLEKYVDKWHTANSNEKMVTM